MAKSIQIRNVPDEVHRQLQARAARAGISISELVLREIRRTLGQPTRRELLQQISKLPRVELSESAASLVRRERDGR
jgi:plasmid stability protein